MSEEQEETMAQRYARLTGKELDEATEELRAGLRSAFEVSQQPHPSTVTTRLAPGPHAR